MIPWRIDGFQHELYRDANYSFKSADVSDVRQCPCRRRIHGSYGLGMSEEYYRKQGRCSECTRRAIIIEKSDNPIVVDHNYDGETNGR